MTQEKSHADAAASTLIPKEFSDMGQKTINAMMDMQKGVLESVAEMNQHWVSRAKSEADLASEFFAKLTAARSTPDTATACQECASRQMEIFVEDGRWFLSATQKMLPHIFQNGPTGGSS